MLEDWVLYFSPSLNRQDSILFSALSALQFYFVNLRVFFQTIGQQHKKFLFLQLRFLNLKLVQTFLLQAFLLLPASALLPGLLPIIVLFYWQLILKFLP